MVNFHETETVELKKSTSELKEGVIALVAVLNKHQRAELWFGIRNDGMAVGQQLFQRSHRIEKWGRGIKMILEREPATEFEEIGTVQFVSTFKRKSYELLNPVAFGKTTQKSSEKSSEKILAALAANPEVRARKIAEMVGLTPRGVEKQLDKLRKQGVLRRVGPDKGGYWEIVTPG